MTDGEGRTYLDFFGGILTTMTGHAVPEVVDAIRTQAGRMLHSSTLYLVRPMVELAERISGLSGIPDAKVFFVNSGSEANDTALQLCCTARRSNQVLALRNSYHGRSFASMASPGCGAGHRRASRRSTSATSTAATGTAARSATCPTPSTSPPAPPTCEDVIRTATAGDVACLIAEPIQGVGRIHRPSRTASSQPCKEVLDEHGILFVSDEVQTGWGRTGDHFWGYQAHGITPDLLTFAKGVGNGLAIGGVVGRAGPHRCGARPTPSRPSAGNPLATAGALANLDYLLSHDLQANALARGAQLMDRLAPAGRKAGGGRRGTGPGAHDRRGTGETRR